jgi:hypothetical protein
LVSFWRALAREGEAASFPFFVFTRRFSGRDNGAAGGELESPHH